MQRMPPTNSTTVAAPSKSVSTASYFKKKTSHHRDPKCKVDVIAELEKDADKPVGGGKVNLTPQQISYLANYHPVVQNVAELAALPQSLEKYGRSEEFAFCPAFVGAFVDATAQHGYFPMALDVGNLFMFAPKCHTERSLTRICRRKDQTNLRKKSSAVKEDEASSPDCKASSASNVASVEPLFDYAKLGLSRKLLKRIEVRVHFKVTKGDQSMRDLHKALAMIRRQHSENWLCASLRSVVQHMMMTPQFYKTSFYVLVLVEKRDDGQDQEILACDMGYIVGDVCTAFTGAYEADKTGTYTLGASAKLLELLEIPIWDLGMQMEYKKDVLSATTQKRAAWLKTIKERKEAYTKEVEGVRAEMFAALARPIPSAEPQSKVKVDADVSEDSINDASKGNACEVAIPWVVQPSPSDTTNAKCQSDFLKDPRKQELLSLLAKGVNADLLMTAKSANELFSFIAGKKEREHNAEEENTPAGTLVPILAVSPASGGVAAASVSTDNASPTNPSTSSKSQLKKAIKAAAILEKKQQKKENGGVLPPLPRDGKVGGKCGTKASEDESTVKME